MRLIGALKSVVQLINCTKIEDKKYKIVILSKYEKNFYGFNYILNTMVNNWNSLCNVRYEFFIS